jgi:Rha family phage regulatory protein
MNELIVINKDGQLVIESREVARLLEIQHKNLLRDINQFISDLGGELKFEVKQYFIESTYIVTSSVAPKQCKQYLLTKKGCDMVAMGRTGSKATLFKVAYIDKFYDMEKTLQQPQLPQTFAEALRLAAELEEQKQLLLTANETLQVELNNSAKHWTIMKYSQELNKNWSLKECVASGKAATAYCHIHGYEIKKCKTNDDRFSTVNSYPIEVLEKLFT